MKIVYVSHAISSCWNNGNAHFLRGLLRELVRLGHDVLALEVKDGWSLRHLRKDAGEEALRTFRRCFPELQVRHYATARDVEQAICDADLVIVHEWVEPHIVGAVSRARLMGGGFQLFFHDTHHRALSGREGVNRLNLQSFDAILAFGRSLAEVYEEAGFGGRVFVLHEAADTRLFTYAGDDEGRRSGIVWVGNWGDGERVLEIERFLLSQTGPVATSLDIYGVRYPSEGLAALHRAGAEYHGFLANCDVPQVFSRHRATVHIPRRIYVEQLLGIPTIRMFEAMASGIPLASAPWRDEEGLFREGEDYLLARTAREMRAHLALLVNDRAFARRMAAGARAHIEAHHTCRHRAIELLDIYARVTGTRVRSQSEALGRQGAMA